MRARTIIAGIVGLGAVIAGLATAWYLLSRRPELICPLSGRGIHAETRALVTIGGRKYETCCLRCGIIEAQQTGKPLRVLEVADFETGKLLNPAKAWFVEGSTVNPCMSMTSRAARADQQTTCLIGFDRCSPSVLAFATEQQARAFMAQHGGILKRLDDLQQEITSVAQGAKAP